MPPAGEASDTSLRTRANRFLHWMVDLRGSPEAIALGAAIGVFIAFTPTIGFQLVLAALLATALNANRPVALAGVMITNPATIPPIYAFTYWIGSWFWSGPPVAEVRTTMVDTMAVVTSYGWTEFGEQIAALAAIGRDIVIPMWIGGVLLGLAGGGATYPVTLRFVRVTRRRLAARRERRARKRASRSARRARRREKRRGRKRS